MAKNRFTEADIARFNVVGGVGGKAAKPAPKKNKFGNTEVPDPETGSVIKSIQEAKDRAMFRRMLLSGEIALYAPQPEVIASPVDPENPPSHSEAVKHTPDHLVIRFVDGQPVIEIYETKGLETPDFKIKWKLVTAKFPQFKWTKLFGGKEKPSKSQSRTTKKNN